jgi:DNA-binding IclR family transcriptional regulator
MMKARKISNLPQTVERALDILETFVGSKSPLGITEISQRVELNKSTTYRILQALLKRGYVHQDSKTNKYQLSHMILRISGTILNENKLREVTRGYLIELSQKTYQTAQLSILENKEIVIIDQTEGKDILRLALKVGQRGPLHCTASGKAILAFLNRDEFKNILHNYSFIALTPKTITSIKLLNDQLGKIRENGYSFCNGEYHKDVRAVGAPIFGMERNVLGSIVLTLPYIRMKLTEVAGYGELVKKAGLEISEKLGYRVVKE